MPGAEHESLSGLWSAGITVPPYNTHVADMVFIISAGKVVISTDQS